MVSMVYTKICQRFKGGGGGVAVPDCQVLYEDHYMDAIGGHLWSVEGAAVETPRK